MKPAITILLFTATLLAARADTLTLTNGDKLTGDIISETATNLQLRTANADFTILSIQTISRTNIISIVRETTAQKSERLAYENLCRYRLHLEQEYTPAYYTAVIAVLDKYLTGYPYSLNAPLVRMKLLEWQAELAQTKRGLVKFHNGWITPSDKTSLLKQAVDKKAQQRIVDLQTQREDFKKSLTAAVTGLEQVETALAGLQDFTEPMYEYHPITVTPIVIPTARGPLIWSSPFLERYLVGKKVTRHPLRTAYEQNVTYYQNRVVRLRAQLIQTQQTLDLATAAK